MPSCSTRTRAECESRRNRTRKRDEDAARLTEVVTNQVRSAWRKGGRRRDEARLESSSALAEPSYVERDGIGNAARGAHAEASGHSFADAPARQDRPVRLGLGVHELVHQARGLKYRETAPELPTLTVRTSPSSSRSAPSTPL